jgi:SPP1 gp7 family putative phage head morphogenesis protein
MSLSLRNPTVEELDQAIAAATGRLTDAAAADLLPLLRRAIDEVRSDLGDWLKGRPDRSERFTAFHLRGLLHQLSGAFEKIRDLKPALSGSLEARSDQAGRLAAKHARAQVAAYSARFQGLSYVLPLDEAAMLASGRELLIPRFKTSAARYVGAVRDDIRQQLALGVLRNETIDELTDRLVRLGGPKGIVALRGIKGQPGALLERIDEGLFRRYRYWAERVVRTEVMHAYNVQADLVLEQAHAEDPALRRRWNAAADWRVCPICRELDGQVVDVGQPFRGGFSTAPCHPNCRCVVGPWKDVWQPESAPSRPRRADATI